MKILEKYKGEILEQIRRGNSSPNVINFIAETHFCTLKEAKEVYDKLSKWGINIVATPDGDCHTYIVNGKGERIAEMFQEEYADQISALPEMFRVCKHLTEHGWHGGVTDLAREAINKIEGK